MKTSEDVWPGRSTYLKLIVMGKIEDKCAFSMMKMMLLMVLRWTLPLERAGPRCDVLRPSEGPVSCVREENGGHFNEC